MTGSEDSPNAAGPPGPLGHTRAQLALLGGLLVAVVLAIVITDVATGGDTKPPPALGSSVETDLRTRVPILPTLLPIETATPVAAATATPSSEADAVAHDTQRLRDLFVLQVALDRYRDRFSEFPNSNGQVQTMCAYKELDKGCSLTKVLDKGNEAVLTDPLGEPLVNGYWYASDGESYSIWMLREGPANPGDPICREVTPHLGNGRPMFCITADSASD